MFEFCSKGSEDFRSKSRVSYRRSVIVWIFVRRGVKISLQNQMFLIGAVGLFGFCSKGSEEVRSKSKVSYRRSAIVLDFVRRGSEDFRSKSKQLLSCETWQWARLVLGWGNTREPCGAECIFIVWILFEGEWRFPFKSKAVVFL